MPYLLTRNRQQSFAARIDIPPGAAVVGRSARATIQIEDRSVSKIHAKIESLPDGRFRIEDMGSRNGIFVDGQRRKRLEVGIGAEVRLGDVTVTFCGDGPETMPIPDPVPRPSPEDYETSLDETRRLSRLKEKRQGQQGGGRTSFLWSSSEQWALILFGAVALLLGASVAWFSQSEGDPTAAEPAAVPVADLTSPASDEARPDQQPVPRSVDEQLLDVAPARVGELQRTWLLLYGRIATKAETVAATNRSVEEILAQARQSEEFWRWRGWLFLGADLWAQEALLATPEDLAQWADRVRAAVGAASPKAGPPLPSSDGDDRALRGWLLERLDEPLALTPAQFIRSSWIAGDLRRDLNAEADRRLLASPTALLDPAGPRSVARLLVHAASSNLPQRRVGFAWMQGTVQWLLGRELTTADTEALLDIAAEHPRLVVEECLLSQRFVPAVSRDPVAPAGEGQIRIEAWCEFPVRPILQTPASVPRLWSKLSSAVARIYPPDSATLAELREHVIPEAITGGDLWVVDRAPANASTQLDVRLVDGALTPALRSVADLCGNPAIPSVDDKVRSELRRVLGLAPSVDVTPRWHAAREVLRLGGYRLVSGNAAGAIHDSAARAVLAALAELDADRVRATKAGTVISVTVTHPPGHEERTWEDFMAALELLTVRYPDLPYELWLWGSVGEAPGRPDKGHRAVRLTWGSGVDRGRVVHETLTARRQHPVLGSWRPAAEEGGGL